MHTLFGVGCQGFGCEAAFNFQQRLRGRQPVGHGSTGEWAALRPAAWSAGAFGWQLGGFSHRVAPASAVSGPAAGIIRPLLTTRHRLSSPT